MSSVTLSRCHKNIQDQKNFLKQMALGRMCHFDDQNQTRRNDVILLAGIKTRRIPIFHNVVLSAFNLTSFFLFFSFFSKRECKKFRCRGRSPQKEKKKSNSKTEEEIPDLNIDNVLSRASLNVKMSSSPAKENEAFFVCFTPLFYARRRVSRLSGNFFPPTAPLLSRCSDFGNYQV